MLDVQEDGLRLAWQLALEFRRSQREQFHVEPAGRLPAGKGRGQQRPRLGNSQDRSRARPSRSRSCRPPRTASSSRCGCGGPERSGKADLAEFDVPLVTVPDAALHNGQLTIRRSPLLELRTLNRSGVTRTDLPADAAKLAGGDESPLGIRPFEAYSFAAVPFTVRLAAAPVAARVSAAVQTVLKLAAYERSLESRVNVRRAGPAGLPVADAPARGPRLDHVSAPGEFQYAVTQQDKRPLLTIYLAAGQQGDVPVLVRGKLGREGELEGAAAAAAGSVGRGPAAGRRGRPGRSGVRRGRRRT